MKKVLYFLTILIAIGLLSSCSNTCKEPGCDNECMDSSPWCAYHTTLHRWASED